MIIEKIPARIFKATLAALLPVVIGAVWLTLKYQTNFIDGLGLSESDTTLRKAATYMMMYTHVAFALIAAMLVIKRFAAWRAGLLLIAVMIFFYDWWGVYHARFGIMDAANSVQINISQKAKDLRGSINGLRESAKAKRDFAPRLAANRRITASDEALTEASRLEALAADKQAQLTALGSVDGTTEIKVAGGEDSARNRALMESTLIAAAMFFASGLAGAMLGELFELALSRAALAIHPAHAPAPAKPAPIAPAQVQDKPKAPRWPARQAGRVGAGANDKIEPATPVEPAPTPAPAAPAQAQGVQKAKVQLVKQVRAVKVHQVPANIREAIESGRCNPSQAAVKAFGCNQDTAKKHLTQLGVEGVIEPIPENPSRWRLVKVAA